MKLDSEGIPYSLCWVCQRCEDSYGEQDKRNKIGCSYYEYPQRLRQKQCIGFKHVDGYDIDMEETIHADL